MAKRNLDYEFDGNRKVLKKDLKNIIFDDLQNKVLKFFQQSNKSFVITGPAGSGKSAVIKEIEIINNNKQNIFLTAMTGVAANLICGNTLHKTFGLTIFDYSKHKEILRSIQNKSIYLNNWKIVDILVIDEVSMITLELFELFNSLAQEIRKNNLFFGGIRLILVGDFLQLGPVVKNRDPRYCFESDIFKNEFSKENIFIFKNSKRQNNDEFFNILERIRFGEFKKEDLIKLESRKRKMSSFTNNELKNSTILYCYVKNVEEQNSKRINELIKEGNKPQVYKVKLGPLDKSIDEKYFENFKIEDLVLCKGARVMHLINDSSKMLWNGSIGIVENVFKDYVEVYFESIDKIEQINYHCQSFTYYVNGTKKQSFREFIPLAPCWAITIHKAQGATLSSGILSLMAFTYGQIYSALSRFQKLEDIWITSLNPEKIICNEKCKKFYIDNS